MAEGLNRVMLIGNLGQDPELRHTKTGQAVLNMRLATNENYQDRDGNRQERTEWHTVIVWGKRAEGLATFLHKGHQLFVDGSLRTSSYEDREGQKRYKTEVNARDVIVLGGSEGKGRSSGRHTTRREAAPAQPPPGFSNPDDEDSIPF